MALPNLALAADLTARGVTPTSIHTVMLGVASSLVREAADSPILETDSEVTLWALDQTQWLTLPGKPVTAVDSVTLDGETLTAPTTSSSTATSGTPRAGVAAASRSRS
jgi:hypothetical protein